MKFTVFGPNAYYDAVCLHGIETVAKLDSFHIELRAMTNCQDTLRVINHIISYFIIVFSTLSSWTAEIAFLYIIFIYFDIAGIKSATLPTTTKCEKTKVVSKKTSI